MTPSPSFHNAAAYLSSPAYTGRASSSIKLELYGLFKFLTVAVNPTASKPSIFDMTGRAKWDAWAAAGSKYADRPDEAEKRYIEIAKEQGWGGDAMDPLKPSAEVRKTSDELLLDSDDDELGAGNTQSGGGMGLSVSALLRPAATKDDTIHGITIKGDVEKLKTLLEETPNADVDQVDEFGYTALHLACDRGHLEAVRILLEKGADRTMKDADEFTPSELAEIAGRTDIVALLSSY